MTPIESQLRDLTGRGLAVFPVWENKAPATPHGFRDATVDAEEAIPLFANYRARLIGIRTGSASGIDVLDIDRKPTAATWWHENRARLPATRTHRSRSGGLHLLFQHAAGLRCSTSRIAIGIDVKADDGCCTWWPAAGFAVLCEAPVAPWPCWLLAQARPPEPPLRSVTVVSDGKLIRGILDVVARASEGERNRALYWASRRLADSTLGSDDAVALLLEASQKINLPPLEARSTIRSAFRARPARGD